MEKRGVIDPVVTPVLGERAVTGEKQARERPSVTSLEEDEMSRLQAAARDRFKRAKVD